MRIKSLLVLLAILIIGTAAPAYADSYRPNPVTIVNTNLTSPSSIAQANNGDVWVADWTQDKVFLYSKSASGVSSPLKSIALFASGGSYSNSTDASSIAVDSNGFLYVDDCSANKIYVFNPSLRDQQYVGDAVRVISLGRRSREIALDSSGKIYAAGKYNGHLEVRVFAAGTNNANNVLISSFTDSSTTSTDEPYGFSVLPSGEIVVAWWGQADIRIYSASSAGSVSPIKTISGPLTELGNSLGKIGSDAEGRIFVYNNGSNSVLVYGPGADGNIAPIKIINLAALQSGPADSYLLHYGWSIALGADSQIWMGDDDQKLIHFDNPYSLVAAQTHEEGSQNSSETAIKLALEAHERAVTAAKNEISQELSAGRPITVDQLKKAEMPGITPKNVTLINLELASLPEKERGNIGTVLQLALKYSTVDKIAVHSFVTSPELISTGLVLPDSKIKTSILLELKKLPSSAIDTFEEIRTAVATVEKRMADRKARLAAILAKTR